MKLNDLSGKTWTKLSKSTWINQKLLRTLKQQPLKTDTICLVHHKTHRKDNMSDHLIDDNRVRLIELLTRKGQIVFDPYLQEGDTMQAALSVQRQFIGIGESAKQCDDIKRQLSYFINNNNAKLLINHDQQAINRIDDNSIDLLLSKLPMVDFKVTDYSNSIQKMRKEFQSYYRVIKPGAYIALVVTDQRFQQVYYCRHADVVRQLKKSNFTLQGLINIIQDENPLRAYGYPSTFVPNIINQFVVIARKIQ